MHKSPLNLFMRTMLIAMAFVAATVISSHASNAAMDGKSVSPSKVADSTASNVDMTGKWNLEVKSATGTGTPVFDLKQEGKTLTGSYSGRYGKAPVTGSIENNAFKISYTMSGMTIVYSGKVNGDTCEGNADFGAYGKATFTGKK